MLSVGGDVASEGVSHYFCSVLFIQVQLALRMFRVMSDVTPEIHIPYIHLKIKWRHRSKST